MPRRSDSPVTCSRAISEPRRSPRKPWKLVWSVSMKSRSRQRTRRSVASRKAAWAAKVEISASRTISKPSSSKLASPEQSSEKSMNDDSVRGLSNGLTNYWRQGVCALFAQVLCPLDGLFQRHAGAVDGGHCLYAVGVQ